MRLVFAGTPEPAAIALEALLHSEHEILAVITRPDAKRGRGRTLHPSPVKALALEHGIEVLTPASLRPGTEDGDHLAQRLKDLAPDCIPVVAYGNLIGPNLLDIPQHGWVNLHFSVLPRWRGASPVQASILAGDEHTGASVFQIEEGLDTGPVLEHFSEPMPPRATSESLLEHLSHKGATLLVHTMDALEAGTVQLKPQQGEASYAAKITVDDARLDFSDNAEVIDRKIRALTPQPGAWALLGEQRIKFGPVEVLEDEPALDPGSIKVEKRRVLVGTASHAVVLGHIQPPGKKYMPAIDWARGQHGLESKVFA
ncbi:methionyl-tRNA formyltransferase [Corynebacterium pelargi]|uniref:Methionyl-tRNA formyltransferase n=1 Tax=Corynebacterium pelargi TaxID=1471400 RepID=A0A410W8N6_9CORY|nr:methionyl-tRNA formyltransferase [Corynebacterium pelargi]QAU52311.1 Methionyl-tRNA formyltransferase [Corynebacterium pelargi]GGG68559.1 methionyl-tRNA formyltransferase [Corynebacterium pelargi]